MFPNEFPQKLKEEYCKIRDNVRLDLVSGKSLEDSLNKNLNGEIKSSPEIYSRMVECLKETDFEELNPRYDSKFFQTKNSFAMTSENFYLSDESV